MPVDTSYAAVKLPVGSVGTKELRRDAVTKTRIHRDAVTSLRVLDHTLKAVDFAPGQLKAGPRGDQGPPGDQGPKGDAGSTLGVAGGVTGCCKPLAIGPNLPAYATKKVSGSLAPFAVTEPLDPGEHTLTLVRDTPVGTLTSSFADEDLGAIALGA